MNQVGASVLQWIRWTPVTWRVLKEGMTITWVWYLMVFSLTVATVAFYRSIAGEFYVDVFGSWLQAKTAQVLFGDGTGVMTLMHWLFSIPFPDADGSVAVIREDLTGMRWYSATSFLASPDTQHIVVTQSWLLLGSVVLMLSLVFGLGNTWFWVRQWYFNRKRAWEQGQKALALLQRMRKTGDQVEVDTYRWSVCPKHLPVPEKKTAQQALQETKQGVRAGDPEFEDYFTTFVARDKKRCG